MIGVFVYLGVFLTVIVGLMVYYFEVLIGDVAWAENYENRKWRIIFLLGMPTIILAIAGSGISLAEWIWG